MDQSPSVYDRAAQLERTALAWSRTSLAIVANGALLAQAGLVDNAVLLLGAGLTVTVAGAVLWVLAATHYSALAGHRAGHLLAGRPIAVRGLSAFVTLLSLLALVAILVR